MNCLPFSNRTDNYGSSKICEYFKAGSLYGMGTWKQIQNSGTVIRVPEKVHKRITTASKDRYLTITAHRN